MDQEELKKFLETMNQLNRASGDYYDKLQDQITIYNDALAAGNKSNASLAKNAILETKRTDAYEQQLKALGLVKNALGEWERFTVQLTDEQKKRINEEKKKAAQEEVITNRQKARDEITAKMHSMLADKTGSLLNGLSKFGDGLNKTVFDSTRGQSKYGEVLDNAGSKIKELGGLFGPFGKAIATATGGLFQLAGSAMKQQEGLNKAYETLSEIGAVDVTGIEGMFKNLQNAGFTVKELDKFGGILKTAGPNLATLGMTAAEGAKKFSETLGAIKNTGAEKELRMLGFTSETMAKTFADYQGMMGRQGFIQGRSTAEIAKKSVEYAKTLDELSKLTGESRDEMQKRMDADANDLKFRLKLQEVDEKSRERLQKASALVGEFSEDTASGFREMIANNGKVVGEASTKLMLSTGNAAKQIVEDLNAGKISHTEAARLIAEAKAQQVERFREVGKLDNEIMRELGITAKDLDAINKYRGKTQEEVDKLDKERQLQMKGELDNQRANEVQRQITERNMEQSKDRLVNMVGKVMVSAFEKLHQIVNAVAKGLAEFTKFITFGKVDFTDLFSSTDDIAKKLKATTSDLDKTNKRIEEINSAKERFATKEKEYLVKNEEINALKLAIDKETNAEKKKAMIAELQDKQKERAILKGETDKARTDMRRGGTELKRLEATKEKLEKQQSEQKLKLEQAGGPITEEKESPEIKKVKDEQEKLILERNKLNEVINDKQKLIYQSVMDELNLKEEDLKDANNRKKFEDAYSTAKKSYLDRRSQIDKDLEKSEKELAEINKKAVDTAKAKLAPSGVMGVPGVQSQFPPTPEGQPQAKAPTTPTTPPVPQTVEKNLKDVAAAMQKRGMTDQNYIKAALGNVMKETGGTNVSENLDYSKTSNERIRSIFGKRAAQYSDEELNTIKRDPQQMAEVMYGGEFGKKQLGNTEVGDAWKFRGRGYIGITGRTNYAAASKAVFGDDRLVENPELLDRPDVAAEVTAWYFEKSKSKMQAQMGFGSGDLTKEQADLLTTSQVAGGDVRKKSDYIKGELLGKVSKYSGQMEGVLQTAASGGLMSGPEGGYPVLLHGKELVIPMPDTTNLASALESVSKTPLPETPSYNVATETTNPMMDQFIVLQTDLMNMIAAKLDALDSRLAKSNDIQENILTYSAS